MINTRTGYFIVFYFSLVMLACTGRGEQEQDRLADRQMVREVLEGTNIKLLEVEDQEIEDFIRRHGLDLRETGSGLRYGIIEEGDGPEAEHGMTAVIKYRIRLLTGDVIYSSDEDDLKEFRIGRGGVESGLEEGILYLNKGDKAIFIMPAHLAHGFPGDGVKIPKRAAIVYDVELIDLK